MSKHLKLGDVFVVHLDKLTKRYVQYIGADSTQLNSDVLRIFKHNYNSHEEIEIDQVVNDSIDFHVHVNSI
jgi:hypothetical protein